MRFQFRVIALSLMVLGTANCSNLIPFLPDDPQTRGDRGQVFVHVRDQNGVAATGVYTCITIGDLSSECARTRQDGSIPFYSVPAGRRRVTVALPAGFSAEADDLVRDVDVVNDAEVTVTFQLTRY